MFRTRDFVLIFITIVFLLVAIGSTSIVKFSQFSGGLEETSYSENDEAQYSAVLATTDTLSREKRLEEMKRKIAASQSLNIQNSSEETVLETENEISINDTSESGLILCDNFQLFSGQWPGSGVENELVEGARIFFTKRDESMEGIITSQTTQVHHGKDVLLQLPVRNVSMNQNNCIATDVIGIAKDGSLIRNNEVNLYGIFSDYSIVGYALDGYPIYGSSNRELDGCGGAVGEAGYGYYINPQSQTIINCFSANPVTI